VLLVCAGLADGQAQTLQGRSLQQIEPGRDRPVPELPPAPSFDFSIEAPRRSPVPRAVEELSFEVKDIRVVGATVYSPEELRPLFAPLIGQSAHLSDITGVADQIEAKYRTDGYILTRAFVPPQSVSDGVFQINVVEGYVEAASVEGGDDTTRETVRAILDPVLQSRPLRLSIIEPALLRANELPGVGVSGLLRPSPTQPGASDLAVTISSTPITTVLSVDNRNAKTTNRWTESADVAIRSPLNDGGQILLSASGAPQLGERRSLSAKYVRPMGTSGITVSMSALISHTEPQGTLTSLNLATDSKAYGFRAAYPLLLTRQNRLSIDGGLTFQMAEVNALGQPFSHDAWRVVDAAVAYQNTGFLGGVSNASIDIAHGLNMFGASSPDSASLSRTGGRPDFTKLSTILRRIQPLGGSFSAAATGSGQFGLNTLLLGEEISFGGAQIGRGYDPASLVGDSGAGGAFELRYDQDASYLFLESAQFYIFYDIARIWNRFGGSPNNDTLESTGAGVRLAVTKSASAGVELAHVMIPLSTNNDGTRNTRILFTGSLRF
jgi:hemolysin activation/secretion protein